LEEEEEEEAQEEGASWALAITQSSRQIDGDDVMIPVSFESTGPPPTILVHFDPIGSTVRFTSFPVPVLVPVPIPVPMPVPVVWSLEVVVVAVVVAVVEEARVATALLTDCLSLPVCVIKKIQSRVKLSLVAKKRKEIRRGVGENIVQKDSERDLKRGNKRGNPAPSLVDHIASL
jgi:hypothetical protein